MLRLLIGVSPGIRLEPLPAIHGPIDLLGRHHAFLHNAVRNYCRDRPMEEVQDSPMSSLEADSELVNSGAQEIGLRPPYFMPHPPQPLQSELAFVLYFRGQFAEPFQEGA